MRLPILIPHKISHETHISDAARKGVETVVLTENRQETFLLVGRGGNTLLCGISELAIQHQVGEDLK